jgi:hypothetical protein
MRLRIGLSLVVALGLQAPALARPVTEPARIDRGAPDCTQIPPEVTPPLATDTSVALPLEVRVMAEAPDLATVKEQIAVTRDVFARIGIRMKARYDLVTVPEGWNVDELGSGPSQTEILEFMKDHYRGQRPPGVDVVYFMTHYWAGGFADCIGGVAFPDRAFALGSLDYAVEGVVPAPTADEGVIAAHEIGHLLGAHHHYSNCSEALPSGATRGEVGPCTTMSPLAATASRTFGLLERSYVRYYAEEFARG